jgi:hypothetical protein
VPLPLLGDTPIADLLWGRREQRLPGSTTTTRRRATWTSAPTASPSAGTST